MSDAPRTPEDGTPAGTPDGGGLPGDGRPSRARGALAAWRRSYGASPAHLLLHLAAIALIALALAQSFDARYSTAAKNLALWMVGGAILNDLVALPLYVGADKAARFVWGLVRATTPRRRPPRHPSGRVLGNGHVRVPLAMSAALLLVYFPNITHKPGGGDRGYHLTTGLAEQPDYASRWLAITAGLLIASAVIYGVRRALARTAAPRPSSP
jgi:hypothetical protein